jgi:hypothetical protein
LRTGYGTGWCNTPGKETPKDRYREVDADPTGLLGNTGTRTRGWKRGFVQFFWNSSRQYVQEAILGYKFFGLEEYAKLVVQAAAVAKQEEPLPARREDSDQAFSHLYDVSELERFDERLFEEMGETLALRLQYLREHWTR